MYGTRLLKNVNKTQNIDETILYLIVRREKFTVDFGWTTVYGIHVQRYAAGSLIDSCKIEDYSSKQDSARQLLEKLRRNKVKPAQVAYVVEDHLL